MKKPIFFLFLSITSLHLNSKAIMLPVEEVIKSITSIKEIKVLSFKDDSVMVYENAKTQAKHELDCRNKKYSEEFCLVMKEREPDYDCLEGTYPEVGETLIMVEHNYAGNRLLFAREEDEYYRFWDPGSIPFANTVYYITENGPGEPTRYCLEHASDEKDIGCSDGFRMTKTEFKELREEH